MLELSTKRVITLPSEDLRGKPTTADGVAIGVDRRVGCLLHKAKHEGLQVARADEKFKAFANLWEL